jgi:hypothetical protein
VICSANSFDYNSLIPHSLILQDASFGGKGTSPSNRRSVPSFAKARAAGRRISTAHVESVMNHLINHRMSKKQQMRWSPAGAHSLLQVVLNS